MRKRILRKTNQSEKNRNRSSIWTEIAVSRSTMRKIKRKEFSELIIPRTIKRKVENLTKANLNISSPTILATLKVAVELVELWCCLLKHLKRITVILAGEQL
jgi:hypothetical protein